MAVFTVQNVPDSLKEQFKETCKKNGESMAKAIKVLMAEYLFKASDVSEQQEADDAVQNLFGEEDNIL